MALPININELINGSTVEWERIEFKKGWNPEQVLKTITAFANDFNNWGGGYIIIGIEEENGRPILPPVGLKVEEVDNIQKELNNICRKIIPNYFPIVEPVDYQGKKILILWCPGGSVRPYKCADTLGKNPRYFYYIRRFSSTVKPTIEEEKELISMSNQIPFDDRVNYRYSVKEFELIAIKTFLNKVESELEYQIPGLSIVEIARKMNIAEGSDENLLPKNVGLLFFAKNTQKIFPSAQIEVVIFKDKEGIEFEEKIFDGNLFEQTINVLNFLKNQIVKEKVIKREGKAEADRFFNYPYQALEEAVCNAVYHRGYDNDSPIEIRIYPDHIDIISFPGPLPPLNKEKLQKYQFDVRKYRNRRIGEFLKELHLTEGRQTGIPTILKEIEKNQSPKPIFETDDERSYFKTTFFIHPEFREDETSLGKTSQQAAAKLPLSWIQVGTEQEINKLKTKFEKLLHHEGVIDGVNEAVKERLCIEILYVQEKGLLRRTEMEKIFKISKATAERDLALLKKLGLIEFIGPPKTGKYMLTEKGSDLLDAMEMEK